MIRLLVLMLSGFFFPGMIRLLVLRLLCALTSSFSVNMCGIPQDDTVLGRKIVPLICKPPLRKRDVVKMHNSKLVYEATFEEDRIIIRPQRRRVRKTWGERLARVTKRLKEWRARKTWVERLAPVTKRLQDWLDWLRGAFV